MNVHSPTINFLYLKCSFDFHRQFKPSQSSVVIDPEEARHDK